MRSLPSPAVQVLALASVLLATGCASISSEAQALWEERLALELSGTAGDAELDAFVAKCRAFSSIADDLPDRSFALRCAIDACQNLGTYEHARSLRAGVFAELLPLIHDDEEQQTLLLTTFGWPGRRDPEEARAESAELLGYLGEIERRSPSALVRAASYRMRVQLMMARDRTVPLDDAEREQVRTWLDVLRTRRRDLDSYWGDDLDEVCDRSRAAVDHNRPGEPALDIEGEDAFGVPMKLSDFRGKVVVVSFWGFW